MRDIGKNILELRRKKGMSQDELAEKLFVTRQTVSNYENGKSRPDVEMLMKIAEMLDSDMNAVLYGLPVPEAVKQEKQKQLKRLIALGTVLFSLLIVLWILTPIGNHLRSNMYYVGLYVVLKIILKPIVFFLLGCVAVQGAMLLKPDKTEISWGKYVRIGILAVIGVYAVWNVPFALWSLLPNDLVGNSFPAIYIPLYTELSFPMYTLGAKYSYFFILLGAAWRFFKPFGKKNTQQDAEAE